MYAFVINPEHLKLNISGHTAKRTVFSMSANPYDNKGLPFGLVSHKKKVYSSVPDGLPVLVLYESGNAEIRTDCSTNLLLNAVSVVSGSMLLVHRSTKVKALVSPLDTFPLRQLNRIGIGTLPDASLLVTVVKGTVEDLQTSLYALGVKEGMMLAYNNVYLHYERGGLDLIDSYVKPLALLEAIKVTELARPLVVIDAGHGGADPGTCAFGVQEKNITLECAQLVHSILHRTYKGTYILTRGADTTVGIDERVAVANQLEADLLVSIHFDSTRKSGLRTYCHPEASVVTRDLRKVLHRHLKSYLLPRGVPNYAEGFADFQVLRDTKGSSVLVEPLCLGNPQDLERMQDKEFLEGIAQSIANGVAKGIGASRRHPSPTADSNLVDVPQTLYRVQTGSYHFKRGAEQAVERLRRAGFEATIVEDRGDK